MALGFTNRIEFTEQQLVVHGRTDTVYLFYDDIAEVTIRRTKSEALSLPPAKWFLPYHDDMVVVLEGGGDTVVARREFWLAGRDAPEFRRRAEEIEREIRLHQSPGRAQRAV